MEGHARYLWCMQKRQCDVNQNTLWLNTVVVAGCHRSVGLMAGRRLGEPRLAGDTKSSLFPGGGRAVVTNDWCRKSSKYCSAGSQQSHCVRNQTLLGFNIFLVTNNFENDSIKIGQASIKRPLCLYKSREILDDQGQPVCAT